MTKNITAFNHLNHRIDIGNRRKNYMRAIITRLSETQHMLIAIEWGLVVWTIVPLIRTPMALNMSFIPDGIILDFKSNPSKKVNDVSPKNHSPLPHRGKNNVVLVVEVIKNII